jgi:hypothetical protein
MKFNTLIICLLTVSLMAFSKSTASEFVFMDIPITGSVKDFVLSLEKKGFKSIVVESSGGKMTGVFAQKDVDVYIMPTPKTNVVYAISVVFDEQKTWESIKFDYLELKDALTKKYGNPISRESFNKPYYEGDGYEMTALLSENVTFVSRWVQENGEIVMTISDGGNIQLFYTDRYNKLLQEREKRDLINSDL